MPEPETAAVTVIIPCYKCAATIERAVRSVASQTLVPAEVILVEDCSGDGTVETLHALQNKYPAGWIQVVEQPENRGPGEARNSGWERASQPYIAFLDADDSWHPQKIEIQYNWMEENPDVALTGHATERVRNTQKVSSAPVFEDVAGSFQIVTLRQLLLSNRFPTRSVMLRRGIQERFATYKYHSEDYLLWLEIVCAGGVAARCEERLAYLFKGEYGDAGLSAQMWNMQRGELDTYQRLRENKCIGSILFAVLSLKSVLAFLRRLFVFRMRLRKH